MQRRNIRQAFAMDIHFLCHEVNAIYDSAFGWIKGYLRGLRLQISYFFHQSFGRIINRGFKSCYFPLYAPYTYIQSCNRILIRLGVQRCRVRFLCQFRIDIRLICLFPYFRIDIRLICFVVQCILECIFINFASYFTLKVSQRIFCSEPFISRFRINFIFNSSFIISYIGSVCRNTLPLSRCRILQIFDIVLIILNVCLFTIFSQQSINLTCRINFL